MRSTKVTRIGFYRLLEQIVQLPKLEKMYLDFSDCNIEEVDSMLVLDVLKRCRLNVMTLLLRNCNLDRNSVKDLIDLAIEMFEFKNLRLNLDLQL